MQSPADDLLPEGALPVICCRVGDPEWVENPHSVIHSCGKCLLPVNITLATLNRAKVMPGAMIVCVNCVRKHTDATNQTLVPLKPDQGQVAEGNSIKSRFIEVICQCWRATKVNPVSFSLHINTADCIDYINNQSVEESQEGNFFILGVTQDIYNVLSEAHSLRFFGFWPTRNTILERKQ